MKYRKKPIVIEAFRFGFDDIPEWINFDKHILHEPVERDSYTGKITFLETFLFIQTLEGAMRAYKGDYVIKGVKDEIYPCKADIFEATYEPVIDN